MKKTFLQNLRKYLKSAETAQVPFGVVGVQHLADGVVAVRDTLGEYDVYFDSTVWKFKNPKIWDNGKAVPAVARYRNIGILPGLGRAPAVKNFDEALEFAQQQLEPKNFWHYPWRPIQKKL